MRDLDGRAAVWSIWEMFEVRRDTGEIYVWQSWDPYKGSLTLSEWEASFFDRHDDARLVFPSGTLPPAGTSPAASAIPHGGRSETGEEPANKAIAD